MKLILVPLLALVAVNTNATTYLSTTTNATTSMLFSTATDASIGGWAFRDGDVIRYDGTAFSLWLSEGIFSADEDIDALAVTVPVPVPGTALLLAAGLAALFLKQERKL